MYYRLYDTQTGCYMATGYNTTSKKQLAEDYISYKSLDWSEETFEHYCKLSLKEVLAEIGNDEFIIEKSKTKFKDE